MQEARTLRSPAARSAADDVTAGSLPSSRWFALYTASRQEKRVAEHLGQRAIECFLPLYRADRRWSDGSRVRLDLPLFPGYLFIHIARNQRGHVLSVPGAVAVVGGTGGEPAALPDATIEALRRGLQERGAEPYPLMTAGRRVRIRSGAFAGFEGVVVRSKNGLRVVLTLQDIFKSYAVEVDREDLEELEEQPAGIHESSSELALLSNAAAGCERHGH